MVCRLLEEQEHKVQKAKLPKSLGTGMLPDVFCQVRPEVGGANLMQNYKAALPRLLCLWKCSDYSALGSSLLLRGWTP